MSALAQVLKGSGCLVSGSDRKLDRGECMSLFEKLAAQGIKLMPQDGSGVTADLDAVVISTAVEPDTPDYRRSVELGIPVIKRPELLSLLVNSRRGICFSGTSGKSTATALAAFVLKELGFQPNFLGGAAIVNYLDSPTTGNAFGGESDIYCVEACESDGSITLYRPAVGAILNIQRDHYEIKDLLPMFRNFAESVSETMILNADCPNTARLSTAGLKVRTLRFSLEKPGAAYYAADLRLEALSAVFSVEGIRLQSPLPGRYNVANVLAAMAACEAVGVKREDFARILPTFRGTARRFQVVGQAGGVTVVDDYAHNPSKVAAVLSSFDSWPGLKRRIVFFQPHGYGPARFFLDELVETLTRDLKENDLLILPEIYYAGGTVVRDISSRDIAGRVSDGGREALYFEKRSEALPVIAREASAGDVVLVLGARDDTLSDFCREILEALQKKQP